MRQTRHLRSQAGRHSTVGALRSGGAEPPQQKAPARHGPPRGAAALAVVLGRPARSALDPPQFAADHHCVDGAGRYDEAAEAG